jgi:hypothetical protein
MSTTAARIWITAGLPITLLDAWLSMQAMFGLLAPRNPVMWVTAVVVGVFFTAFAVMAETLGMRRRLPGKLLWAVIFAVDMATSVLCAVWYGQLHHSFKSRIMVSQIHFVPGNWVFTFIYLMLVVIAAGGCIQLGRAFETLLKKSETRESGRAANYSSR